MSNFQIHKLNFIILTLLFLSKISQIIIYKIMSIFSNDGPSERMLFNKLIKFHLKVKTNNRKRLYSKN